MHEFQELVYRSTNFALYSLNKLNKEVSRELNKTGSSAAVRNLQMIQLHKVVVATGIFSIFEANLQDRLDAENGFKAAKDILLKNGNVELYDRFEIYIHAINVLKHGRGNSYNSLVKKAESLPFKIKMPDENFFFEGDVSEASTLIQVTDDFVLECAEIIGMVSTAIYNNHLD